MKKPMRTSFYTDDEQDAAMRKAAKGDRVFEICFFWGMILLVLVCCFRAALTGEEPGVLLAQILLAPYVFALFIGIPVAIVMFIFALICR